MREGHQLIVSIYQPQDVSQAVDVKVVCGGFFAQRLVNPRLVGARMLNFESSR